MPTRYHPLERQIGDSDDAPHVHDDYETHAHTVASVPAAPRPPLHRRDSPLRWVILALSVVAILGPYEAFDGPAATQAALREHFQSPREVDANSTAADRDAYAAFSVRYELLYTLYSFPNIVLPVLGGLAIDRLGMRTMLVASSAVALAGQVLVVGGVAALRWDVLWVGRAVFGAGTETLCVAQRILVARWFIGGELALAMGVVLAFGRFGSVICDLASAPFGAATVAGAYGVGAIACVASLIAAGAAAWLDARCGGDEDEDEEEPSRPPTDSDARNAALAAGGSAPAKALDGGRVSCHGGMALASHRASDGNDGLLVCLLHSRRSSAGSHVLMPADGAGVRQATVGSSAHPSLVATTLPATAADEKVAASPNPNPNPSSSTRGWAPVTRRRGGAALQIAAHHGGDIELVATPGGEGSSSAVTVAVAPHGDDDPDAHPLSATPRTSGPSATRRRLQPPPLLGLGEGGSAQSGGEAHASSPPRFRAGDIGAAGSAAAAEASSSEPPTPPSSGTPCGMAAGMLRDLRSFSTLYWVHVPICCVGFPAVTTFNSVASALLTARFEAQGIDASTAHVNAVMTVLYSVSTVLSFAVGALIDRLQRWPLFMGAALAALAAAHAGFAATAAPAELLLGVLGVGFAFYAAAFWPSLTACAPAHAYGSAYGLMGGVQNAALALVPLAVSALQPPACAGAYSCVSYFFAAICLAGVLLCGVLYALELRGGGSGIAPLMRPHKQTAATRARRSTSSDGGGGEWAGAEQDAVLLLPARPDRRVGQQQQPACACSCEECLGGRCPFAAAAVQSTVFGSPPTV